MIIKGFGISLHRLQHEDIELVRQKRNAPNVSAFMEYREEITPEMQEKWFQSINNEKNNYFIIDYRGERIGLIYAAEIDWQKMVTGNSGIFIWEEEFRKTSIPLAAALLLTETSFIFGFQQTFIKVLRNNFTAIEFNKSLGYELLPGQENVVNQKYVLEEEKYFAKAGKLREPFIKEYGDVLDVIITDKSDLSSQNIIRQTAKLTGENKRRLNLIL
jgi:RimJ/RimL family protein N-acetyltransferase